MIIYFRLYHIYMILFHTFNTMVYQIINIQYITYHSVKILANRCLIRNSNFLWSKTYRSVATISSYLFSLLTQSVKHDAHVNYVIMHGIAWSAKHFYSKKIQALKLTCALTSTLELIWGAVFLARGPNVPEKVNPSLAISQLKFNGGLFKLELTSLIK